MTIRIERCPTCGEQTGMYESGRIESIAANKCRCPVSRDTPRPTCPANLRADGDTDEEFCLLPKGHTGDHRFESVDGPAPTAPRERETPKKACGHGTTKMGCGECQTAFYRAAVPASPPATGKCPECGGTGELKGRHLCPDGGYIREGDAAQCARCQGRCLVAGVVRDGKTYNAPQGERCQFPADHEGPHDFEHDCPVCGKTGQHLCVPPVPASLRERCKHDLVLCYECNHGWTAPRLPAEPPPIYGKQLRADAPVASGTPKEQERADAALWLSRSSLWLHIPQLANIPSGFGGTMFDAIAALRKEYPGDYPLDKFSPAPVPPVAEARETVIARAVKLVALRRIHNPKVRSEALVDEVLSTVVPALMADLDRLEQETRQAHRQLAERDREHQKLIAAVAEWQEARTVYDSVHADASVELRYNHAEADLLAFPLPTPTPENADGKVR